MSCIVRMKIGTWQQGTVVKLSYMFRLVYLLLSLLFVGSTSVSAMDIEEIRGKEFAFKEPKDANTVFDCFFEYNTRDVSKPKKIFAAIGKETNMSEILGHVFSVDSIVFVDKRHDVTKGILVLLRREDGVKLVLRTPKYKADKKYVPKSNINSYSHSLVKSKYVGRGFKEWSFERIDVYSSCLDFDVYDITSGDKNISKLLETNRTFLRGNIYSLPQVEFREMVLENNVPTYKLRIGGQEHNLKIEELSGLIEVRKQTMQEAVCVDSVIIENRQLNVDSLNQIYAGKDFWINHNVLWHYGEDIPAVHVNYEVAKRPREAVADCNHMWKKIWMNLANKSYSEGMIGGATWKFFRGRIDSIVILPLQIPADDYWDYKRMAKRNKWPKYVYYMRVVPSPTYEYETYRQEQDYKTAFGVDINDTIFIPFDSEKLKFLLTDQKLRRFEAAFDKEEQAAWNEHMKMVKGNLEILTKAYGAEIAELIASGKVRFGFTTEMCKLAFDCEPYRQRDDIGTPLGAAILYEFYTKGVKLYFINDRLIGIQWKGNAIQYCS